MEEVLNVFLRSHRVLQVEQRLVETPGGAAWSFCIRYFGEADVLARGEERDYRKELGDEAFERFKALRTRRNELAKELGLKPFQLFTNDEMAQMARLEEITAEGMKSIRGIGDGKVSTDSTLLDLNFHREVSPLSSRGIADATSFPPGRAAGAAVRRRRGRVPSG